MKVVNFTHYDLDGVGCAYIVKQIYPDIEIISTGRNKWQEKFNELLSKNVDTVIITDLCLSQKELNKVSKKFKKVIYIDHHPDSFKLKFPENVKSLIDNKHCGTTLTYKFFFHLKGEKDKRLLKLCRYICDYDLWKLDYIQGQIFEIVRNKFGFFALLEIFNTLKDGEPNRKLIKIYEEYVEQRKQYFDKIEKIEFNKKICVMFIHKYINEITLHFDDFNYYVLITDDKKMSIRSRDTKVDLNKVIKPLSRYTKVKGGGHKNAIGLHFENEITERDIELTCKIIDILDGRNND